MPKIDFYNCNFIININSEIRDIVQSQNSNNSESEYLKKEIEFLKSQLEFSQNLIQRLLTGKEVINA